MEMIAAAKMKRAQAQAIATRPYAAKINDLLADLAAQPQEGRRPLLERRKEVKKLAIVHITPDRGLCGGLNANLNRHTVSFIMGQNVPVTIIAVGRKGRDFLSRYGCDIRADFSGLGDRPSLSDTLPISRLIIDDYSSGFVDQVYLVYTEFVTTMTQRPALKELLPITPVPREPGKAAGYIYEPDAASVLEQLLPRYMEMLVYHALLESIASEQSARMVAMRNATENASDMIQELTLTLNKARQEMITTELLDIVGGAAALE
jgi:F-type H+-transporting ATPase subunit gamma